ncbi:hypothetical protein Tsubulata_005613 [Turnera subulata]|uniref:Uncharacterized protein n=1 Tax=Turnera subulata TaxID=218843 RepID=A0A9Q0JQV1_9ROSI|nr:hypothetical protein Tsubulata_005613 [Turnera subulata]
MFPLLSSSTTNHRLRRRRHPPATAYSTVSALPSQLDPAKKEFAQELFSYTDSFNKAIRSTLKGDADEAGTAFDYLETSLSKFDDGPFFLGQFRLVEIAYAPFIERFQPTLLDFKNYDITAGRPKLAAWIEIESFEEMDRNEAYNQTKRDPKQQVESYRQRFGAAL